MTINRRLSLLFAVIALALVALVGIAAHGFLDLRQRLIAIERDAAAPLQLAALGDVYAVAVGETARAVQDGRLGAAEGASRVQGALDQAAPLWARYRAERQVGTDQALIDTVATRLAAAEETAQAVLAALGTDDRASLTALVDDRLAQTLAPLAEDLAALGAAERRAAAAGFVQANDEIGMATIRLAAIAAAALIALMAALWIVRRQVVAPLSRLTVATRAVAAGRDIEIPDQRRGDEVGELAQALGRFKAQGALVQEQADRLAMGQFALDQAVEAILWVTEDGAIAYTNQAYRRLMGYHADELTHMTVHDIAGLDAEGWRSQWQAIADIAEPQPYEGNITRKDGSSVAVEAVARFLRFGGLERVAFVMRDISLSKDAETAVAQAHAETDRLYHQFADLTEAIPGAVFQLRVEADGRRRYVFVSGAARALRGIDPVALTTGQSVEPIHPADRAGLDAAIADAAVNLRPLDLEFRDRHPDGERWIGLRATARRLADGAVLLSGVWLDVTDRVQREGALATAKAQAEQAVTSLAAAKAELDAARIQAEAAGEAKSTFLAVMSHEIRAPLNGVVAMAEVLAEADLDEDARSMAVVIRQSADALLAIVSDILDIAKIEAGRLELEAVPFSLSEVAEGVGAVLAAPADDKGIELVVDLDPRLPDMVTGDPTRLRQVLMNLAGNAVKFTDEGGVLIKLAGARRRDGAVALRIDVTDSGIGLTDEQIDRLFQPFEQADPSTARHYGSTGLGLSIARRLVDLMGGTLTCESVPGEGATFTVELVLLTSRAVAPPIPEIADARIAILGADGWRRDALVGQLYAAGIEEPLWLTADRYAPKVLAGAELDLTLACLGHEPGEVEALLDKIARDEKLAGKRFVVAGPQAHLALLKPAVRHRIEATLGYPIRRARLWSVIAAALGRAAAAAPNADLLHYAPPPLDEAQAARAAVLVVEDNPVNRQVIGRLLDRLGYAHVIAEGGRAGLTELGRQGFGLVLTDLHMPGMDGFALAAEIRAQEPEGARLPIVALTADALPATRAACLAAGMDDCLTKPLDAARLAGLIGRFMPDAAALRRRPLPPEEAGAAAVPETTEAPVFDPGLLDTSHLVESFGGFTPAARAFLADFAANLPDQLESLEMSFGAADFGGAHELAHALTGAARSVGASAIADAAAAVQDALEKGDVDHAQELLGPVAEAVQAFRNATEGVVGT